MRRLNSNVLLAVVGALSLAAMGCESGGVGDPCVPEDEYNVNFPGYSETEVNVESRSFQCETRICLVNHFRGRVSCPYGQEIPGTNEEVDGVDHTMRCKLPGTETVVEAPVRPQLEERQQFDAVYCSCRCKGPDPNARYCECPGGFSCEELISDLGLGSGQLAGSYCVRNDTVVKNPDRIPKNLCTFDPNETDPDEQECGDPDGIF